MRRTAVMLPLLLAAVLCAGCSQKKTPAPAPVAESYHALRDSLSDAPPAAAANRLAEFQHLHARYTLSDTVLLEVDRLRAVAADGYHEAREMARRGEFDRAEILLQDLATYLPGTPAGSSAAEYLAFDFGMSKAQWLMARQRFGESESAARELLDHELTPVQANQVEALLDNLGYVDAAFSQVERQDARNACRHLSVVLMQQFVEEGRYPSRLSIRDIEDWPAHDSEFVLRGLSAIEGYRMTDQGYSFVGVSTSGAHRIRVTDGRMEVVSD